MIFASIASRTDGSIFGDARCTTVAQLIAR
jgi:hypothetical protein